MEKILVSATEAAGMLSIGKSTFFKKVTQGLLPNPVRIGTLIRWRVDDLRAAVLTNYSTTASAPGAGQDTAHGYKRP